jgi:hypothetical protein
MGIHSEAQLDVKFIDFARQLQLYLNHFPSFEKYGLSLQIRNAAYSFYGYVVESQSQRARFVRKHSLYKLTQSMKKLRLASVVSILGHARHTASLRHLLRRLRHSPLWPHLPSVYRRAFA